MKRLQKVVALLMLIVLIPLASFANEITEEDTSIVRNPDRGFYKLVQVDLQQGDEDYTRFEKQIISVENEYPDISIISFQLNLKNYTQKTEINKNKRTPKRDPLLKLERIVWVDEDSTVKLERIRSVYNIIKKIICSWIENISIN